jgi:hypothetical protein
VINNTFNINKLRLPLLVLVNILNINKTFLAAFSFYLFKSAESIDFIWESIKAECFINGVLPPHVVIGD